MKPKEFNLKKILKIIDSLEIDKSMLPGFGITTARWCLQFREADTKEYIIIYKKLFERFEKS